jgi:hypothetical protein
VGRGWDWSPSRRARDQVTDSAAGSPVDDSDDRSLRGGADGESDGSRGVCGGDAVPVNRRLRWGEDEDGSDRDAPRQEAPGGEAVAGRALEEEMHWTHVGIPVPCCDPGAVELIHRRTLGPL